MDLEQFDEVILLGSKLVIKDLHWLKEVGLFNRLRETKSDIFGICGGFEMMFQNLIDDFAIESNIKKAQGLGFIDDDIIFQKKKIVKRGRYHIFGRDVEGFEIHYGVSKKYPISFEDGNIRGTFVHGIFEDRDFEIRKRDTIDKFVNEMRSRINVNLILKSIL